MTLSDTNDGSGATLPSAIDRSLMKQHVHVKVYQSYIRYVAENYPQLPVQSICEQAGLPFSELWNDSNWTSCLYTARFMTSFRRYIKDPMFCYNAGLFAVSRDGLGAVYHLVKAVFTLRYTYRSMPRLTSYFNKVVEFKLVQAKRRSVVIKLTPLYDKLDPDDRNALSEIMPVVAQNAMGYYTAMPRIKSLPDATVSVSEAEDAMFITVRFPAERYVLSQWLMLTTALVVVPAAVYASTRSFGYGILGISLIAAGAGSVYFRRVITNLRGVAHELEEHIGANHEQYRILQQTQMQLDRRLQQERVLNAVSGHLIASTSEAEMLQNVCQEIETRLSYDRVVLYLSRDAEVLECAFGCVRNGLLSPDILKRRIELTGIVGEHTERLRNVFISKCPILIDNAQMVQPNADAADQLVLRDPMPKSFIAVPVASADESFGVLVADNYISAMPLSADDLDVLVTVGRQVANVLQKLRTQEKVVQAYHEIDTLARSYSRFVPFNMIRLLERTSVLEIKARGGKEYDMAVLFSDIRGFTTMAEQMTPADAFAFLNSYFDNLAPTIEAHGGTIDKFLGDGMMALFMEPSDAFRAAVAFQHELTAFNQRHRSGLKRGFIAAGVGIHFGRVLLGAVGYHERLNISATSDAVNVASRLDELNKIMGLQMVCSGEIASRLNSSELTRFAGRTQIRGRHSITELFEILGHLDGDVIRRRKDAEPAVTSICELISNQEFVGASDAIDRARRQWPDDPLIRHYAERMEAKARTDAVGHI